MEDDENVEKMTKDCIIVKMVQHISDILQAAILMKRIGLLSENIIGMMDQWWNGYDITAIIKKLFGCIPEQLNKDQCVLLKLSLPEECFV